MILLFVTAGLSQDRPTKIVWSNIDESYNSFHDIKPRIELKAGDLIFWKMLPEYFLLYRYDETKKNWVEGNCTVTDTFGMPPGSLILKKGTILDGAFFAGHFFTFEKGIGYSFQSQNRVNYPVAGKYRMTFFYGTDPTQPDKLDNYTHSPEFLIVLPRTK